MISVNYFKVNLLEADALTSEPPGKPIVNTTQDQKIEYHLHTTEASLAPSLSLCPILLLKTQY